MKEELIMKLVKIKLLNSTLPFENYNISLQFICGNQKYELAGIRKILNNSATFYHEMITLPVNSHPILIHINVQNPEQNSQNTFLRKYELKADEIANVSKKFSSMSFQTSEYILYTNMKKTSEEMFSLPSEGSRNLDEIDIPQFLLGPREKIGEYQLYTPSNSFIKKQNSCLFSQTKDEQQPKKRELFRRNKEKSLEKFLACNKQEKKSKKSRNSDTLSKSQEKQNLESLKNFESKIKEVRNSGIIKCNQKLRNKSFKKMKNELFISSILIGAVMALISLVLFH